MKAESPLASIRCLLEQSETDFQTVDSVYAELARMFAVQQDATAEWLLETLFRRHSNLYLIHYLQALALEYVTARESSWQGERGRTVYGIPRLLAYDPQRLETPLLDIRERNLEMYGQMPHLWMMDGSVHFLRGDLELARKAFKYAAELADRQDRPLQRMYLGAYSVEAHKSETPPPSSEHASFAMHRRHDFPVTILIGADMVYLRNFAPRMVESVDGKGVGIHFHVINPEHDVDTIVPGFAGLSTESI
ncbi:hypothetical protein KEU06_01325 [Pseudaminobacter sp. 19-2017]|uniref:Uncharacterized protein n=1 Tax=Pseudaminobacter soli (ex Zhang et al. 2022) TaxID=2831468 RepID=A0A942I182_9HYPH|nr:hypothetical protein [Pseudaminobacter soli]MBS3647267.1 hypothetical protein [Pseudaminobacter soli]